MERRYQTTTITGAGGTFTLRLPILPTGAEVRGELAAALGPVAAAAAAELQAGAQALYPVGPVTASFQPFSQPVGPTRAGVRSDDPILPFMEFATRPHWPPAGSGVGQAGPGSRLSLWTARHPDAPPTRVVARLIAFRGTKGRYVLGPLLERVATRFAAAASAAITGVLRGL